MSFIERDLITNLLAQSAVTSLCGTRVFPMVAPDGASHPYVVIERVGGDVQYDLEGESGHKVAVIGLSAVAKRYADAKLLAGKIALYLSGLRGAWANSRVMGVFIESESDDYAEETEQYIVSVLVRILFKEI